jgi:plastocyanin
MARMRIEKLPRRAIRVPEGTEPQVMRHLLTLTTMAIILAGCSGQQTTARPGDGSAATDQQSRGGRETIDIVDFAFAPDAVEVPAGTTVTWTQSGASRHTVDFADGEESGDLAPGATFARTFDTAGSFTYVCFFHPSMTGSVTVTD